jgi:hypothetical protein
MQTTSAGKQRTKLERACVLYDRHSGTIRHIQHVIVMEGGREPNEREIEHMARSARIKRGLPHDMLDALHLDRSALQPFTIYRVDPHRKALVEDRSMRRTSSIS